MRTRSGMLLTPLCLCAVLAGCRDPAAPKGKAADDGPGTGAPAGAGTGPGVVITGKNPIAWSTAEWEGGEQTLRLALAEDSDWAAAACADGEYLAALVLHVRDAQPGEAARHLVTGTVFKSDNTVFQSVLKPEGKGLDFIFTGGNLEPAEGKAAPAGAVIKISHGDQLKPEAIRQTRVVRLRLSPRLYAPALRLEGGGRLAVALQKFGRDDQGVTVSNVVEVAAAFPPAKD